LITETANKRIQSYFLSLRSTGIVDLKGLNYPKLKSEMDKDNKIVCLCEAL